MRFSIHELPYETPLAAGQWRYEQDGEPTGAVEAWRLTAAQDGWSIWRVELDARAAASGRSTLYHLLLDADGRPAQLRYRLWRGAAQTSGTARIASGSTGVPGMYAERGSRSAWFTISPRRAAATPPVIPCPRRHRIFITCSSNAPR